jgi:hypothetical protein
MSETSDTFAAVIALIALVADPKACAKRLAELQATIDAADKAQAQLAIDRAAHERAVAEANHELDGRRSKNRTGRGRAAPSSRCV